VDRVVRHGSRLAFAVTVAVSLVVLFSPGSTVPSGLPIDDKVVHAGLFAVLALTGSLAGVPPVPLAAGLVVYAGASEVLQTVLPIDRDGDWRDALADTAGVAVGMLAARAGEALRSDGRGTV
jgi:hypothetical protein